MDGSYILDTAARRKVRGRRRRRRTQAIAKGYAFYSKSKRDSDIGASVNFAKFLTASFLKNTTG